MNSPLNILIVDDNKEMVQHLKSFLERKGHKVTGTYDVGGALDAIRGVQFDAMVIDVCLDALSGVSLLKSVKTRGDICPVIMISGYATQEMAAECLNLGAYDFLFKPFRLSVIADILEHISDRKERLTKMGVTV